MAGRGVEGWDGIMTRTEGDRRITYRMNRGHLELSLLPVNISKLIRRHAVAEWLIVVTAEPTIAGVLSIQAT